MILLVFTWTWKLSYFDFKETAILERSGIREIKVQRCGIGGTSSHINIYWKTINIKLHVTYISIVIDFPTINRWIFLTIFYSLNFTVLAIVPAANFWKSRIRRRLKSIKTSIIVWHKWGKGCTIFSNASKPMIIIFIPSNVQLL